MAAELTGPVRDLLAAVAAALDIPLPSIQRGDEQAYHQLLERRTSQVRIDLLALLDEAEPDLVFEAAFLEKHTAAAPVTYTPFEPAKAGDA
ncbi:hypothetical protein [Streptomyces sp. NBC_00842]|uniref:hypothetical protein n=1 Tax=Streptomyces sp. NBC_00842 TaxID=2975848 RepID=UPI00386F687D|nr:hypothetical protein OH821_21985 [Streptomyces sp. NBC_00842]